MGTKEYRTIDKSTWGNGPWNDEPDKRQWKDDETGLPCLIVRGPSGSLCGYVGVPPRHPAHGLACDHYHYSDDETLEPLTPTQEAINKIPAHGGLTFAGSCGHGDDESTGICHIPGTGEPDDVWWFGFDCAHAGDYSPAMESRRPPHLRERIGQPTGWGSFIEYRDIDYVTDQCAQLAAILAAI